MSAKFELIICIVNSGFADTIMDLARGCGAKGGTVVSASGTAKEDGVKLCNIVSSPEKEIILLVVNSEIKDDILHAIYKNAGLNSDIQGIAFSLPVDDVAGFNETCD